MKIQVIAKMAALSMLVWFASCTKPQLARVNTADAEVYLESKIVQCGGEVDYDEKSPVHSRGVCWMQGEGVPTLESNKYTSDGNGWGSFKSIIDDGLKYNQTYSYCAYAVTEAGVSYGAVQTFILEGEETKPVVTTGIYVLNTLFSTVKCTGNVKDDGVGTVEERGFCWSTTNEHPSLTEGTHSQDGSGEGDFNHWIPDVTPGDTYYYCAYAINEYGTSYGDVLTFCLCSSPTVTTTVATVNTEQCSAQLGGNVTNDGGGTVTARGVCYSTTYSLPTIYNSTYTSNGTGTGSFTTTVNNLTQDVTYYYRAYATNGNGTSYGSTYSFKIDSGGGGGYTFDDFEGTYTLSAYDIDNNTWKTYTGVSISQFYNSSTSSYWVMVEGIMGGSGYTHFTAIGEYSQANQCIRLYGTWHLTRTFYFNSDPSTLYYAVHNPIYASTSDFTVLSGGGGYNGCSEAWLTMDSKGNLTYGPSNTPDDNNLYANGFVFYYYNNDTNEYAGRFEAYKDITLTKTSKHVDTKAAERAKQLVQSGALMKMRPTENYNNTLRHE